MTESGIEESTSSHRNRRSRRLGRDHGADQPEERDRLEKVLRERGDAAPGQYDERHRHHRPADQAERDHDLRMRLRIGRSSAHRAVQQVGDDGHAPPRAGDAQAPEDREPRLRRQDQNAGERQQRAERDTAPSRRPPGRAAATGAARSGRHQAAVVSSCRHLSLR